MKKSKTFRLSDEAVEALSFIAEQTGSFDTAIVE